MKKLLLAFALMLMPVAAHAQSTVKICVPTGNGNSCQEASSGWPVPVYNAGGSAASIAVNADTQVLMGPGTLIGISVNTAGVTSSATIYDDEDGTCSSSKIAKFSTTAVFFLNIPAHVTNGICVNTTGGTPADITVFYRAD